MKKMLALVLVLLTAATAHAQVSVPNTFVTGGRILASEMNANFDALESGSLNRGGGTVTGDIVVESGVTIDGIDIGAVLGGTGNPTFATLTVTGTSAFGGDVAVNTNKFTITASSGDTNVAGTLNSAGNFSVATNKFTVAAASGNTAIAGTLGVTGNFDTDGVIVAGSGGVQLTTAGGKIQALTSTYFDSVDGTSLTGLAKLASANTFTAQNNFLDYTETTASPTISAGSLTLDLDTATHFLVSLNANITSMTVSNVTASKAVSFTIRFTADGTLRTVSWPSGTVWASGAAPTMTSTNNKRDFFTFITYDGGTTWFAFVGGQNF